MEKPPKYSETAPLTNPDSDTTATSCGCELDTRYVRSIEGILTLTSLPLTIIGMIIAAVGFFHVVGAWYFFVGVGYIFYATLAIVIETFIPRKFLHRLVDAIVVGLYSVLWALASMVSVGYAIAHKNVVLGISAVFGFACCGLCIAQVVFALKTWNTNGHKVGPSQPVIPECNA